MKGITDFFKSDVLWKQIAGTIIATALIWILTVVFGLIKGLNYSTSIQWTLSLLNSKIDLWWLILLALVILIFVKRIKSNTIKEIKNWCVSQDEFNKRLGNKVDLSNFERFVDVYDYRRLKNHPWHDQYAEDGVESFINMLEYGINKNDLYKIENALQGLTAELKEREWQHGSEKNRILQLINSYFQNTVNHYKTELEKTVNMTRVL